MTIKAVELLTRANHLVPAGDAYIDAAVDHHAAHIDALGLARGTLQAHASGLHGVGVAQGLNVRLVADGAGGRSAVVSPGVAVDTRGRHILLATGGAAETSADAVEPDGPSRQVAVADNGVAIPLTLTAPGTLVLTIQCFERSTQDGSDALPVLRHTPWLRWQSEAAAAAAPDSIPLALARLVAGATPTLEAGPRRPLASTTSALSLLATTNSAGVVQEQIAAQLQMSGAPATTLRVGGASAAQKLAALSLDAQSVTASGDLHSQASLTAQSSLKVGSSAAAVAVTRFTSESIQSLSNADLATTVPTNAAVKTLVTSTVPPGTVVASASEQIPAGWSECNGASLDGANAQFGPLFAAIGKAFGGGNGSAAGFNLPDLRGRFVRGWSHGSGSDPDRAARQPSASGGNSGDRVGSYQEQQFSRHDHTFGATASSRLSSSTHRHWLAWQTLESLTYYTNAALNFGGSHQVVHAPIPWRYNDITETGLSHSHVIDVSGSVGFAGAGNETRPRNVYLTYIIKL